MIIDPDDLLWYVCCDCGEEFEVSEQNELPEMCPNCGCRCFEKLDEQSE